MTNKVLQTFDTYMTEHPLKYNQTNLLKLINSPHHPKLCIVIWRQMQLFVNPST